jgi:hypothetical protein
MWFGEQGNHLSIERVGFGEPSGGGQNLGSDVE